MNMKKFSLLAGIVLISMGACNNEKKLNEAVYEGEDLSGVAVIQRDNNTKVASVTMNTDGDWQIYSGRQVETIDFNRPLLTGTGSGTFQLDVPTNQRSYFQVVTEKGKAILAERHLPMEGGYNFRDLGGISTQDGRYVKWGKLFRSDDLHSLTDDDLTYLSSIPLTTVVDFRSGQEMESSPDRRPASVENDYPFSITPGNLPTSAELSPATLALIESYDMDSMMMSINEQLVTDTASIRIYVDFFRLVQQEDKIPLLFHCSAGKDRTGMAAALILFALGVDEDTVMQDYLLSNQYIKDKYAPYIERFPSLEPVFSVKPEFLQAGIRAMKHECGSIEEFLVRELHINIDKMREMYLY